MNDQQQTADNEQIWLTPSSAVPFWTAVFAMITLVGGFLWWPIAAIAGAIALGLLIRWTRQEASDNSELPRS